MLLTTNFSDVFKSSFLENATNISVSDMIIALSVSFLLGLLIYWVYKKTFSGMMYSRTFNISLISMTMVTALVITGVTSNIVLSLGMVGALSIVRFRAAIKDPMDIFYLFWSIAVGILCGAGLILLAIAGSVFIALVLLVMTNKITDDVPYLLIVKYSNENAEKAVNDLLSKKLKKFAVKSKIVSANNGLEIVYELRLSDLDTSFVNEVNKVENVNSAVMVSYDGNYGA